MLPHERTHRGPKEGRLRLLRAVRAQLEPIFLLYDGEPPFAVPAGAPDLEVEGHAALAAAAAAEIAEAFADRQLLIADGHHRYETALAFHEEDGTDGERVHARRARQHARPGPDDLPHAPRLSRRGGSSRRTERASEPGGGAARGSSSCRPSGPRPSR